jgi:hypothetical protein
LVLVTVSVAAWAGIATAQIATVHHTSAFRQKRWFCGPRVPIVTCFYGNGGAKFSGCRNIRHGFRFFLLCPPELAKG